MENNFDLIFFKTNMRELTNKEPSIKSKLYYLLEELAYYMLQNQYHEENVTDMIIEWKRFYENSKNCVEMQKYLFLVLEVTAKNSEKGDKQFLVSFGDKLDTIYNSYLSKVQEESEIEILIELNNKFFDNQIYDTFFLHRLLKKSRAVLNKIRNDNENKIKVQQVNDLIEKMEENDFFKNHIFSSENNIDFSRYYLICERIRVVLDSEEEFLIKNLNRIELIKALEIIKTRLIDDCPVKYMFMKKLTRSFNNLS